MLNPFDFRHLRSLTIRPVLRLKDGAGFMHFDGVPDGLRYLNAIDLFSGADTEASDFGKARIICCCFPVMD